MESNKSLAKEEEKADEDSNSAIDELVSVLKISSLSSISTCGSTNKEFKVVDNIKEANRNH